VRSSARKRERNRIVRSAARTHIKMVHKLISEGKLEEAQAAAKAAIRSLDKAAEKGVIHKNNAARRKSRLIKKLNETMTPPLV
jgi:small subunit ribosomal protein S20